MYQSAYAGALKVLLDLIPKAGWPVSQCCRWSAAARPGTCWQWITRSKPVLSALKASEIHQGVFAVSSDIGVDADGAWH